MATEPVKVLYLDVQRVTNSCTSACDFHVRLIRNLLQSLAGHALLLNQKIEYITQRTTREKLLSYLSDQALRAGNSRFQIPSTDRSWRTIWELSAALCPMNCQR